MCFYIFLQHALENSWQRTEIQRRLDLSVSSAEQQQKTCWFLDFEKPLSSPRLQWPGELLSLLRRHWTPCKKKKKKKSLLSPLCLTEGLFLWTTANCCPVISPAALTPSRTFAFKWHFWAFWLFFSPSSSPPFSHFHRPRSWEFLTPTVAH